MQEKPGFHQRVATFSTAVGTTIAWLLASNEKRHLLYGCVIIISLRGGLAEECTMKHGLNNKICESKWIEAERALGGISALHES